VFCPEEGAPYQVKPRFFSSPATFRESSQLDGFVVLSRGEMLGRWSGRECWLHLDGDQVVFSDDVITATLGRDGDGDGIIDVLAHHGAPPGHRLPLWWCHVMRALLSAVLAGPNPVSAAFASTGPVSVT
jgi:hypothetical protein